MEAIRLLSTSDKICWEMPIGMLIMFSAEFNCSIPFEMFGEKAICRYGIQLKGVTLYVTPVFNQSGLICLKSFFDHGEKAEQYQLLLGGILSDFGEPVYKVHEKWERSSLTTYPCNIWVLSDSVLEVGIHEERFIPFGYVTVTEKKNYKDIYTGSYLSRIGWAPKNI